MIYGLYLSSTGVITNSHQQDVIANNLANSETSGFKRAMARTEQRQIEAKVMNAMDKEAPPFDNIGGGQFLAPTFVDLSQGSLEMSANPFDTAVSGSGFLGVQDASGQTRLTRAGQLMINRDGNLITAQGHKVLDKNQSPIQLDGFAQNELKIAPNGDIRHNDDVVATIGLFDADPQSLRPIGENMFAALGNAQLAPASGSLLSGFVEQSNVDPANELTRLMETQRLLEANANMIKYQDSTLSKLVNEVGKIS